MFDLHCHICYGTDDGAESLETAVEMVALASRCGTSGIAVTPHCNVPGSYKNYWGSGPEVKIETLRKELSARNIPVELYPGQEIFATPEVPELLRDGSLITLNGTRYPLIEFDFFETAENARRILGRLTAEGYTPVIAHPERYAFVCEIPEAALELRQMGCLLQLNKGSLVGRFGPEALYSSRRLIEMRLADIVASDAHSPYMRTPNLKNIHELICEEYSYDYADLLLKENPRRILENRDTVRFL